MGKKAIIYGISGQDGAYLAQLLLSKGYRVFGSSRDAELNNFNNLTRLGIKDKVTLLSVNINDFRCLYNSLIQVKPDEIYNLAGQSSVGLSFEQPVETFESIAVANLNLLEALRIYGKQVRLYNACSSECFGNTEKAATEETPFLPRSPYAVAKAAAYWHIKNYREAYKLYACSGILFNHESPLRPKRFVTQKIISTALKISKGSPEKLQIGNIHIKRDWGWAPEYVEAMWRMLQQENADDYIIATGKTHSLQDFISKTFSSLGLDWQNHVVINQEYFRPTDIMNIEANPIKAKNDLGWNAKKSIDEIIELMLEGANHEK